MDLHMFTSVRSHRFLRSSISLPHFRYLVSQSTLACLLPRFSDHGHPSASDDCSFDVHRAQANTRPPGRFSRITFS